MSEKTLPENSPSTPSSSAAFGGPGWSPRTSTLQQELGSIWGDWGQTCEWAPLRAVLLHGPDESLLEISDPNSAQMLETPDLPAMQAAHQALVRAYEAQGVSVQWVNPRPPTAPNLMFQADLFFMTPQGAILARPASTVRAGEERPVAARLSALGVPILLSVQGRGLFEGADAMWLDPTTAIVATGLRTNRAGAEQVRWVLQNMGVTVIAVELPAAAMHLMGTLRLTAPDLALAWPGHLPPALEPILRERGFRLIFIEEELEAQSMNFVTLRPNHILMPNHCPLAQRRFESEGLVCHTVAMRAITAAAGGIGCLTGILKREPESSAF